MTAHGLPLMDRLTLKVEMEPNSGCWLWTAATDAFGYGRLGVRVDGKTKGLTAHRVLWEHHRGVIPDGLLCIHRCCNVACVNPDHLFLGTQYDSHVDMARKRRGRKSKKGLPEGVWLDKKLKKNPFGVLVGHGGRRVYCGMFATAEEAGRVALEMKEKIYAEE